MLPGVNANVLFLPKAGVGSDPQEITKKTRKMIGFWLERR